MKIGIGAGIALAALAASAAPAQEFVQWPVPAAPASGPVVYLPMGTPLSLATRAELNTKDSRAGDQFRLEVAEPVIYRGQVVIPAGAPAVGEVMRSERNGHFGKKGQLEVRLLYVQTPSGPVHLTGRVAKAGTGQGLLAIGGAMFVSWPMLFIHGTSGRLPAETMITAYLADDLRFTLTGGPAQVAATGRGQTAHRPLPAHFDPSVFASNQP